MAHPRDALTAPLPAIQKPQDLPEPAATCPATFTGLRTGIADSSPVQTTTGLTRPHTAEEQPQAPEKSSALILEQPVTSRAIKRAASYTSEEDNPEADDNTEQPSAPKRARPASPDPLTEPAMSDSADLQYQILRKELVEQNRTLIEMSRKHAASKKGWFTGSWGMVKTGYAAASATCIAAKGKLTGADITPEDFITVLHKAGTAGKKIAQYIVSSAERVNDAGHLDILDQYEPVSRTTFMGQLNAFLATKNTTADQVFSSVSEEPLGSGTIATVYRGTLRATGAEVAIKILKPGIKEQVETSISPVNNILWAMNKTMGSGRGSDKSVDEICCYVRHILDETNLEMERRHLQAYRKACEIGNTGKVTAPFVCEDLCSDQVLVMEYAGNKNLNQMRAEARACPNTQDGQQSRRKILHEVAVATIQSINAWGVVCSKTGLAHNDLHFGNIQIHNGRIYIIDMGNCSLTSELYMQQSQHGEWADGTIRRCFMIGANEPDEELTDIVKRTLKHMASADEMPVSDADYQTVLQTVLSEHHKYRDANNAPGNHSSHYEDATPFIRKIATSQAGLKSSATTFALQKCVGQMQGMLNQLSTDLGAAEMQQLKQEQLTDTGKAIETAQF